MPQKRTNLVSWVMLVALVAFCVLTLNNIGTPTANAVPAIDVLPERQAEAAIADGRIVQPRGIEASKTAEVAFEPVEPVIAKLEPSSSQATPIVTPNAVVTSPTPEPALQSKPASTSIDDSQAQQGLIIVTYSGEKKGKLRVEKEGVQYTYDLFVGSQPVAFPLQLGSGQYTVKIYEHVEANRYKVTLQEQVLATIMKSEEPYLHNMQLVNWRSTDKPIVRAQQLVKDKHADYEKLVAIHNEVINQMVYDYQKLAKIAAGYIPDIAQVWATGKGICFDYASVLASMLRSQGIPAKLVKGYSPNIQGYHAWNEVYLADEGRWVIVDATYDAHKLAAGHSYELTKPSSQYQKVSEY